MFSRLPTSSKHLHHSLLFAATMFICSGCQLVAPTPADNATTLRHNEQLQAMYADLATTLSGYYAFGHSEFEVLAPDDAAKAANSSQGSSNQAAPVVLPLTKEQALAQALRQRGAAVCQSLGTCALKATPLHTDLTQTEEFTLLELFAPDLTLQRLYSARALPLGPVSVLGACAPIVTDMSASMAPPRGVTPPAMVPTTAPRASGTLVADTQVQPPQQQQQNLKLQPKQQTAARNNDRSAKNSAEVAVRAVATPASAQKPAPNIKPAATTAQKQDTATPKGASAVLATTASKDVTPSTAASASGSSKAPVLTARNTSSKAAPEPEPEPHAASATASSTTVDIAVSDLAAPFTQRADATANAPHDTYGVTPLTTTELRHNSPGFALSDLKAKVASLAAEAEQREYAEQVASTVEALRSSNNSSKHSGHSLQETPVFTAPANATTPQEHHKSAQPAAKQAPVVIPPEKLQFAFSPEKPQPRPTTTAAKPQQQQKQQQPEQGPTTAANDNTAKQRPAADKQVSAAGVAALTERYGLMSRQQPQREVPVFFSTTPGDRYSQRSSVHEMSPESLVSSLLRATGKSSSTISSSNNHSATHLAVMTPLRLFVSSIK